MTLHNVQEVYKFQMDKYFEDFKLGERYYIPPRTMTDAHFLLFSALNGDNHPIHYDDTFCQDTMFGKRVTHGLLLTSMSPLGASTLAPLMWNSMVAFIEQSSRFLKPVFIGDTVAPEMEVVELIPKGKRGIVKVRVIIKNQKKEVVMEGQQVYMVKCRG